MGMGGGGYGGWGLCCSGRNRDAVFKPLRPPRRSRGELWVGMWDDMFKRIAGLTHSRYSASSFWLAHL